MKTTYLVNALQPDGTTVLVETSAEHWREIAKNNRLLPKAERRYFIVDVICEPDEFDSMIIEVPYNDYLRWDSTKTQATRNRTFKKLYQHFSKDAGDAETIPSPNNLEDTILGEMVICELHDALANWHPWGPDFLWFYLNGKKTTCTSAIAQKYGVSQRQARTYKDQFEMFVKKFLC